MTTRRTRRGSNLELATQLTRTIAGWLGVQVKNSRFSCAPAFFVDGIEFGHFHESNEIDIRLTRTIQKQQKDSLDGDNRVAFRKRASDG